MPDKVKTTFEVPTELAPDVAQLLYLLNGDREELMHDVYSIADRMEYWIDIVWQVNPDAADVIARKGIALALRDGDGRYFDKMVAEILGKNRRNGHMVDGCQTCLEGARQ